MCSKVEIYPLPSMIRFNRLFFIISPCQFYRFCRNYITYGEYLPNIGYRPYAKQESQVWQEEDSFRLKSLHQAWYRRPRHLNVEPHHQFSSCIFSYDPSRSTGMLGVGSSCHLQNICRFLEKKNSFPFFCSV